MAVFFQDFRSLNGERRQLIVEERDLYDSFLRDLIRSGQDEGIVCPDIEPKLAAITVLGMMNWIYHWYRPGGELSASEIANAYADFVVAGLACDRATHKPGHRQPARSAPARPGGVRGERLARPKASGEEARRPQGGLSPGHRARALSGP